MSGRRSDPMPPPLRRELRDGVLYVGRDPWRVCHFGCNTHFDPTETDAICPTCDARLKALERAHWQAIAEDALLARLDSDTTH